MGTGKFKQLINPHSHSHYSLDGASTIEDIVLRNKELGATHVAITEHGNMNSALELYDKAHKHGLKPICGIELYVRPPFLDELEKIIKKEVEQKSKYKSQEELLEKTQKELLKEYVHLTVHFKDEWAYNYFTKLTPVMESRALVKYGERKPIITLEELAGAAGHITICSSCLIGMVNKFLLPRRISGVSRPDLAEKAYLLLKEIAGKDNFFVEIFPHTLTHEWVPPKKNKETGEVTPGKFERNPCTPFAPDGDLQKTTNSFILNLAKKYNDRVIVSLDSHFATPDQKIVQDARLGNGQENWKFYTSYHICPSHEAFEVLKNQLQIDEKEFEKWIENSYEFASHFDNYKMTTNKERWVLQSLPDDYQSRLIELIQKFGRMDWNDPIMCERLRYEIEILANNDKINLLSYFFTVEDIASFCKSNDILINVRGSAGGSLLLYLLGVSSINPLKHGLSFERFLTLGRIKANTLPDVDIDVADQHKVLNYLENKYKDAFCRISVDTYLKLKSSIKDAERAVLGKVRPETEKLCVTLPKMAQGLSEHDYVFGHEEDGVFHPGLIDTYLPLKRYIEQNPEIWQIVCRMMGIIRQKSQHACGVVIADRPVQDYIPVTVVGENRVTGYSPKQLELAGLIKYDILGLNTLRDLQLALSLIKENTGKSIDPFNLPHSREVFYDIGEGDTVTVFQFDTDTVRPFLKAVKPKNIDELAVITALCRPGTLDAPSGEKEGGRELSLAEIYVARAQGRPVNYIHPDLIPIMEETLGVQLYQEQTLRIFRDIAGYTFEQAEAVRRGIGKKDEQVLSSCMGDLRKACLSRGWTEEQVNLLVEQIMASSRYSFNKSHAISYAYVAYACAYLKHFYPIEWWTAILANAKKEDLQKFWPYANKWIIMPDINNSDEKFTIKEINGQRVIQAPITLLDGVGSAITNEIAAKKPFKDFADFFQKIDRRIINKRVMFKFILGGLLDSLFPPNYTDLDKINEYLRVKSEVERGNPEPIPEEIAQMTPLQKLKYKRNIYTVYKIDWTDTVAPYLMQLGVVRKYNTVYMFKPGGSKDEVPLLTSQQLKRWLNPNDEKSATFAIAGYVAEAKEVSYNKPVVNEKTGEKSITAHYFMKFIVEIGDLSVELIKWPKWGETHHGIKADLNERIVIFTINRKYSFERGVQLAVQGINDITDIDRGAKQSELLKAGRVATKTG